MVIYKKKKKKKKTYPCQSIEPEVTQVCALVVPSVGDLINRVNNWYLTFCAIDLFANHHTLSNYILTLSKTFKLFFSKIYVQSNYKYVSIFSLYLL